MHPALSIVVFTVLSGAGFGLVGLACLAELGVPAPPLAPMQRLLAGALGLGLATLGLLASTLHLANPRNAWRAFFRFRTSWLSREAVFSVLFYPCAALWLGGLWWQGAAALTQVAAAATAALAAAAVYSTGMIYASLRTIPQWHTRWVPLNYLLLAAASGSVLATAVAALTDRAADPIGAGATLAWLAAAGLAKLGYYRHIGRARGLAPGAELGVTQGRARLLDSGQAGRTFLDNEFRRGVSAGAAARLRLAAAGLGFALPALLVAALLAGAPGALALPAVAAAFAGLGIERWLFFAEARHVVTRYYGDD